MCLLFAATPNTSAFFCPSLKSLSDLPPPTDNTLMRPHGVMFHHLHGNRHPCGQGSLSAATFADIIERIGPKRILPARQWMHCALTATLRPTDVCLTFDDNLLCQYDVALPVLRSYGLTAFWFAYTSVCQGNIERLELYRHFRTTKYESVEDFYSAFFDRLDAWEDGTMIRRVLATFKPREYLKAFPFYTETDRQFRFVRDELLGPERYTKLMDRMLESAGLNPATLSKRLWMGDSHLKDLHSQGHVIGLHSHTHPTRLERLSIESQRNEYGENFKYLQSLLGEVPEAMSHPCNSYNRDTLKVLREMGIRLGFCANMAGPGRSELEYPREDPANLLTALAA
jgi:peptidoglycan/xylan/chitin deacetylase (PgdA/CDA1 family)